MKEFPIIKVVLALITGIILQKIFQFELSYTIGISFFLIFLQLVFSVIDKLSNLSLFRSLLFIFTFLFLSASYLNLRGIGQDEYPFSLGKIRKTLMYGTIENLELPEKTKFRFTLSADSLVSSDSLSVPIKIKILCRVYEDSTAKLMEIYNELALGNKIKAFGTFSKPAGERNPGEFDYAKYLRSKNISALFSIYEIEKIEIIDGSINRFGEFISELRIRIQKKISELSTEETAGLITGLLLADRSGIDYELREDFINAGVIHVLAVSGLHVGFIAFIFYIIFNRFNIYARYLLTIAGLIFFMILTGMPPSVFRATVMAVLLFFAFLFNRSYNSFNALAFAAFIILLTNPAEIFNPGFQLSFSAVLSILIFYPIFQKYIKQKNQNRTVRFILLFGAVSLAAQIGTLPFTLYYFHKISVIALIMNLFVIPIIAVIISVSIITLLVSLFSDWLAIIYASANNFFSEILFRLVSAGGSNELSFISVPEFSLLDILIFYFFAGIFFAAYKYFNSIISKFILMILVFLNIYVFVLLDDIDYFAEGRLTITAVDVGQGDAFLVKFPEGKTALIDAGNSNDYIDSGARIKSLLQKFRISKIDFGFVSHIDADHYGGFLTLIKEGLVETVFKPEVDSSSEKEIAFENFLRENSAQFVDYKKLILEFPNCRLYSLYNSSIFDEKKFDSNNRSGVIKISYGENSFLFTGDAEYEEEEELINLYGEFLKSNLLKVGHHGSKKGSSSNFLRKVNPDYALISAGYLNQFKHPSDEVLKRLIKEKIEILRTDLQGAVIIMSTGKKINVINWNNFKNRDALN